MYFFQEPSFLIDMGTEMKNMLSRGFISILLLVTISLSLPLITEGQTWKELAPGLSFAEFKLDIGSPVGDSVVSILRVNPGHWQFTVLCAEVDNNGENLTSREWADKFNLSAVINAGMFAKDYSTHIGYLASGAYTNNSNINNYQSVALFNPKEKNLPVFQIADLDNHPFSSFLGKYEQIVQNLRLIKHPGENRWPQQAKIWSEAALGMDKQGNCLFIFSRSPYSMHDLNLELLKLPIELVSAQHLEGGPEAQLFVKSKSFSYERIGSFETNFFESNSNASFYRIPNIIGIKPVE